MAVLIEQLLHNTIELYVDYYATTIEDPPTAGSIRQTFTLAAAVSITSVDFMMGYWTEGTFPAHRTFRVRIFAANAGTGEIIGDSLGSATKITSDYSWTPPTYQMMTFTFAAPVDLVAGEYAIVVDVPGGNQLWGDFELLEVLPETFWWTQVATWGPRGHLSEQYAGGEAFVLQGTVVAPSSGVDDWAFSIVGDSLSLTPLAPLHEATGVSLAPTSLTWESTGFNPATMVYDVYFRMFGVTEFTLVGNGQVDAALILPDNLAYNFLYFWKVNIRDIATDEILLAGDEWNFNTEALIKYPVPSTRTVPVPGGGGDMTVQTAENCVAAIRYLVAASQNTLWYEYVAGT